MYNVGRICMKVAGRDAGKKCVIVEVIDDNTVLIDGATRRKKCNKKHVEPTAKKVSIKEKAGHEEVVKALEAIGIKTMTTKPKKAGERPKKVRKAKVKPEPKKKGKAKVTKEVVEEKVSVSEQPKEEKSEVKKTEKVDKPQE